MHFSIVESTKPTHRKLLAMEIGHMQAIMIYILELLLLSFGVRLLEKPSIFQKIEPSAENSCFYLACSNCF